MSDTDCLDFRHDANLKLIVDEQCTYVRVADSSHFSIRVEGEDISSS